MSDRPDLEVMWHLLFDDDTLRLRPKAKRLLVGEPVRCTLRRHLQAVVVDSAFGPWVAWRYMRHAHDVWCEEWLDALGESIDVFCHCDDEPRRVELGPYRGMR